MIALAFVALASHVASQAAVTSDDTTPPADDDAPKLEPKSPLLAAALATVIPGTGHLYLGEPGEALGFAGTTFGTGALTIGLALDGAINNNANVAPYETFASLYFSAAWGYNVFDAWRDAEITQGRTVPREDVLQLASAPYDLDTMTSWQTWAALGSMLAIGVGGEVVADVAFKHPLDFNLHIFDPNGPRTMSFLGAQVPIASGVVLGNAYDLALLPSVAVGEESYFRGLIQGWLAMNVNPWVAWVAATLIFGAIHAGNAIGLPANQQLEYLAVGVPTVTLVGGVLGLLYLDQGQASLKRNVAAHYWYDALVLGFGIARDPNGGFFFSTGAQF